MNATEQSYKASPLVSILQCTGQQISTSNTVQLTEGRNSILTLTNNFPDSIYITSSESSNNGTIIPGNVSSLESTPIQFVVIQQADTPQTKQPDKNNGENNSSSKAKAPDKLICGQCEKVCVSVLEFLVHKASHIARGLGQGCEVCSLTFSRTKSLLSHYRRKHKICIESDKNLTNSKKTHRKRKTDLNSSSSIQINDQDKLDVKVDLVNKNIITDNGSIIQTVYPAENDKITSKDTLNANLFQNEPHSGSYSSTTDTLMTEDYSTQIIGVEFMDQQPEINSGSPTKSNEKQIITYKNSLIDPDKETGVAAQSVPGLASEFTNTCRLENDLTGTKTDNIRSDVDDNQNEKVGTHLYSSEDISTVPARFKPDFVVEIDMPDFYFIAIIERGPRNSIKGSKYHFQCLYCDLKLSWRNTMCQHMKERHPNILKAVPTLEIPKQHLDKKHKIIKMSEYIKLEKNTKKNKRIRGIETQDLPGNFPCRKCGKVFSCLRYFRRHEYLHQAEKNLLCSICVKSFKTLANLNQHMKCHKEREAYKCRQCDFQSTVNIAIHAHRQIHKDGCALCDICGQAYNDKSTLTKHKKVHDPGRPFACTFPGCTWRFKSKHMCAAHEKAHTTKGKFECKICGYAFRQKHHLQRHESKVHSITTDNKKCTYTVLPVDYIDEGIIVTDSTKIVGMEPKPVQSEVSLIINDTNEVSVDEQFDLESALQTGQLVIATDNTRNTINYEMTDIGMSASYHTLLPDTDGQHLDTQTVIIPQTDENQIIYQHEEVTETVCTEVSTS